MQVFVFRRLEGDDLRQTLVTIGISIVAADLMLAVWTGDTYQFAIAGLARRRGRRCRSSPRCASNGAAVFMTYPFYRLVVLGGGDRHRRRPLADAATARASA